MRKKAENTMYNQNDEYSHMATQEQPVQWQDP